MLEKKWETRRMKKILDTWQEDLERAGTYLERVPGKGGTLFKF